MIGLNSNTLHNLQNGLENTISIHWTTLNPASNFHRDNEPADGNANSSEEEHRSDMDSDEHKGEDDNTYVIDKIVL